ncbi:hypothetical protein RSSM_01005 [Rhodopirellula sallentina SM41]|uniref:Uncharacterized protein n=2 Tax=Rhodopirellula TaxID=265488 RepID=M5U8E3_9BACT|nr:hypothetical protein RSSM_01005 [Rhodopirellula sallentina SM41]
METIAMGTTIQGQSQTHRFPNLGAVIEVKRPDDHLPVVDAQMPADLLSGEFDVTRWPSTQVACLSDEERSKKRHYICNQLHIVSMSLDLLQCAIADGDVDDFEQTLGIAIASMGILETLATK